MTENCVEIENFSDFDDDEVDRRMNRLARNDDDFDKISDDFLSRKKRCNYFRSISSNLSTRAWNIDKTRQNLLKRLTLLPIGKHSFEVLSKFIINHQILEIVKVLKFGSCVDLHVKVNLKHQLYSKLDLDNIIVKIFHHKTTLNPDFECAKKFEGIIYSKDRNPRPKELPQYYPFKSDTEDLVILRVGHIVFTKMIGEDKPALNLIQMIKSNPEKKEIYLEKLLELLRRNHEIFTSPSSSKFILWHKNQWMIIHFPLADLPENEKRFNDLKTFFLTTNMYVMLKTFLRFGLPRDVLLESLNNYFPRTNYNYYYHERWFRFASLKINEKFKYN